jgi:hypothetical protein
LPPNCNNVLVLSSFGVAPPMATAVVGGHHRSLVSIPLLQTVAVIVLVLLLLPERTPIPDRDSHPRKATYNDNGGLAPIHARGQSSSPARRLERPASIHPLHPLASRQNRRCNSCHVQCPLEVACVRAYVCPLLLLCPLQFVPCRDCDDRPFPSSAFRLPPRPADPNPNGVFAAAPEAPNSASSLSRGASNSSPTLSGISAAPPVVVLIVVIAAVIIINVVDGTIASTSSSRVGQPITRGSVNVAARSAASEFLDFRGGGIGRSGCFFLPPSWRQEPTTMTTKTVASLSRRRGTRRGEDGELR